MFDTISLKGAGDQLEWYQGKVLQSKQQLKVKEETYMIERCGNQSLKRLVEGDDAMYTKFLETWNMNGERHST